MSDNQKFTPDQLKKIRSLDDFDLTMFLSEVHDHGADVAKKLLDIMRHQQ